MIIIFVLTTAKRKKNGCTVNIVRALNIAHVMFVIVEEIKFLVIIVMEAENQNKRIKKKIQDRKCKNKNAMIVEARDTKCVHDVKGLEISTVIADDENEILFKF